MPGVDVLIWPAVVVVCAIVLGIPALFIFRAPISRLMDRISKAGKDGVSFERPQERGEPQTPLLCFDDLMKHPISATVLEREQMIQDQIQSFDLKDEKEKVAVLTRALATTRIEMEFNNISSVIFGSQVSLLIKLSSTSRGIQISTAEEIYKEAQSTFSSMYENRSFEDWLGYLLNSNLITQKDAMLDITQIGSDFLKHLVDARLAYERFG